MAALSNGVAADVAVVLSLVGLVATVAAFDVIASPAQECIACKSPRDDGCS